MEKKLALVETNLSLSVSDSLLIVSRRLLISDHASVNRNVEE